MRIYLAAPYTHPNPTVRLFRIKAVNCMAAKFLKEGHEVFSPLSMGHEICRTCELPTDFSFWRSTCLSMIEHWATHVYVLDLEGWEESVGVREEMALAQKLELVCEVKQVRRSDFAVCNTPNNYKISTLNEHQTENNLSSEGPKVDFLLINRMLRTLSKCSGLMRGVVYVFLYLIGFMFLCFIVLQLVNNI